MGTGANFAIPDGAAFVIDGGANVHIRDVSSTSAAQVECGRASTTAPMSAVTIVRGTFVTFGNEGSGVSFDAQRCAVTIDQLDIAPGATLFGARDDSTYVVDRVFVRGDNNTQLIAAGSRVNVTVTNSVLNRVAIVAFLSDNSPPGSSLRFIHDTFVRENGIDICDGTPVANRTIVFENSIIATGTAADALDSPNPGNCTFVNTLLSKQQSVLTGTLVGDPLFVAFPNDLRLSGGSPAIDAATTSVTAHDLAGQARPVGAAADLGAYEHTP